MIVSVPAITSETRGSLQKYLGEHFSKQRTEGADLNAVISEILNDKDIHCLLSTFLPKGNGLSVGHVDHWDDITVYVNYGFVFDTDSPPRKVQLYTYENFAGDLFRDLTFSSSFPESFASRPKPEDFAEEVNKALVNYKERIINLPMFALDKHYAVKAPSI